MISQDNQDSIQYQDYNQNGNDPDELTFAQHLAKAMTQSQLDFEEYENAKKLEDEELQYVLRMSQNEKWSKLSYLGLKLLFLQNRLEQR